MTETNYRITSAELICEIKPIIKELFIAQVRENSDGIVLRFANGQSFTLAIWENTNKVATPKPNK